MTKKPHTKRLIDIMDIYQLKQIIQQPTRITENSETLIDVFITNNPEKISYSGVVPLGVSDHNLIYASIKIAFNKPQPKVVHSRNFKNYRKDYFCAELVHKLSTINFENGSDPNTMWNEWKTVFVGTADDHAPFRTRRVKSTYSP